MLHLIAVPGAVLGAIAAAIAVFEGVRRLVRRIRKWRAAAGGLATAIRAAGRGAQDLAELAGSITLFASELMSRVADLERDVAAQNDRFDDFGVLLTDALADIARLERRDREP